VLFDKGDKILKSVDFQKTAEEWSRQLRTASSVPDRADAAVALGTFKDNDAAVNTLGDVALHDKFWGVREEALRSLGRINSPAARKQELAGLSNEQPWVRVVAIEQLGKDRGDDEVIKRLQNVFKDDKAYTVRAAALQSLALDKASNLQAILEKTLTISSPGDVLRGAALRAMGSLGDDAVVPSLLEWSAPGKPAELRGIAIGALGRVDLKNHDITAKLISYLNESSFDIRFATIFALGRRGDPTAIEPLEALLKTGELSIGVPHALENLIDQLKTKSAPQGGPAAASGSGGPKNPDASAANVNQAVLDRLDQVEHQLADMNEKLKHIETSMPDNKND
jgi:HEAT repeat protein